MYPCYIFENKNPTLNTKKNVSSLNTSNNVSQLGMGIGQIDLHGPIA